MLLHNTSLIRIRFFHHFVSFKLVRRYHHAATMNDGTIRLIETIRHLLLEAQQPDYRFGQQLYKIYGWVRGRIQRQKSNWFLQLDDGSSADRLQVIIPRPLINSSGMKIHNGISLECVGTLMKSLGHQQPVDFHCQAFKVIGNCSTEDYQISHLKTGMELDLLREQIHLRPRVRYFQSILRIRNELSKAIHRFMDENDFIQVQVPMITTNDCEGGGESFSLEPVNWPKDLGKSYFGRPVYLTVSGQLHLEALASSLSRVYTLNQVFRAEKSMSPKHLSEFLMLELEQAFVFDLESLMDRVESLMKYLAVQVELNSRKDLEFLLDKHEYHKYFQKLKKSKFLRISYSEACRMLSQRYPQLKNGKLNFNSEMERSLLELCDNQPIFVTEFPMELKPFYMKSFNGGSTAQCFDLISPICGEVCGGSLRENHLEQLSEQIQLKKIPFFQNKLEWYMDLRRFGSAPSGGFGLGFDRFIQTLCGVQNIKDVVPFPRWPYHCHL